MRPASSNPRPRVRGHSCLAGWCHLRSVNPDRLCVKSDPYSSGAVSAAPCGPGPGLGSCRRLREFRRRELEDLSPRLRHTPKRRGVFVGLAHGGQLACRPRRRQTWAKCGAAGGLAIYHPGERRPRRRPASTRRTCPKSGRDRPQRTFRPSSPTRPGNGAFLLAWPTGPACPSDATWANVGGVWPIGADRVEARRPECGVALDPSPVRADRSPAQITIPAVLAACS